MEERTISHRRHFPALDGLRGVAIAAVMMFHLYPGSERDPLAHVARVGWLGVDLFFVLSGFLITGILLDTLEEPRWLRKFYARRALRILPVYVVVSVAVVAWSTATGWGPTRWTLPYFVYASNVMLHLGKPIGVDPRLDVTHFWSLAVEEQFYLVWPWVVLWARRPKRVVWVCVAGAAVSVALRWAWPDARALAELPLHMDGLMLGGALAGWVRASSAEREEGLTQRAQRKGRERGGDRAWMYAVVAVCAGMIAAAYVRHRAAGPLSPVSVRYVLGVAAVMFAGVVALAVEPGTWAERVFSARWLRWLGRYSYGMYVLHFPLVKLLERHTMPVHGAHTVGARAVALAWTAGYVALVVVAAAVSYHGLELPCLRLKRLFAYQDERQGREVRVDPVVVESA